MIRRGTPLYKPYRYVPPHWVRFCVVLSETVCPFWSGIGYGFRGNWGVYERVYRFQFQMSKKEREICEFETDLNNFLFSP